MVTLMKDAPQKTGSKHQTNLQSPALIQNLSSSSPTQLQKTSRTQSYKKSHQFQQSYNIYNNKRPISTKSQKSNSARQPTQKKNTSNNNKITQQYQKLMKIEQSMVEQQLQIFEKQHKQKKQLQNEIKRLNQMMSKIEMGNNQSQNKKQQNKLKVQYEKLCEKQIKCKRNWKRGLFHLENQIKQIVRILLTVMDRILERQGIPYIIYKQQHQLLILFAQQDTLLQQIFELLKNENYSSNEISQLFIKYMNLQQLITISNINDNSVCHSIIHCSMYMRKKMVTRFCLQYIQTIQLKDRTYAKELFRQQIQAVVLDLKSENDAQKWEWFLKQAQHYPKLQSLTIYANEQSKINMRDFNIFKTLNASTQINSR